MNTKYILFCVQEANFCTRSMLIPSDLIMKCPERIKDLQVLRENSLKNVSFDHKGKNYVVDQLLIQKITWGVGIGEYDVLPFTAIVQDFIQYANGVEKGWLCKPYDEIWSNDIKINVVSTGFNHVTNYCNFRNKKMHDGKEIEIIEGFLVLESENDMLYKPDVDTVEEMNEKYF